MAAETKHGEYRIGEVAERTGVTTRTIRYYEELGLLEGAEREKGRHRLYCDSDIARLRELIRLRDLLGVSLDAPACGQSRNRNTRLAVYVHVN
jgi:hypothetical protein